MRPQTRASAFGSAAVVVALVVLIVATIGPGAIPPAGAASGPGAPTALTVNGMHPATGVDPDALSFAWRVTDAGVGARQLGYRVLVSRRPTTDSRSAIWDSGPVASGRQAFVRYGGPRLDGNTRYFWTVATRDAHGRTGPFAPPSPFVTTPRAADWKAEWVTPGTSPPTDDQLTYVRTTASIHASPIVSATAFVAASHQYQLWINGHLADAGPSFSYPDEQYVQATDVTRLVRAGQANGFGVLHHWYGAGQGRPASQPGLLAQISVLHRDGSQQVVGTDGTWREQPADWTPGPPRNDEGDFTEVIDARRHPDGWSTAGFAATGWSPVPVLGPIGVAPFTHLVAQRTHIATRPLRPVSVRRLASGATVANYGAVYAATPVVQFRHGTAGTSVSIHAGFALSSDGSVSTTHENQGTDMGYQYTQRAGASTFRPFGYLAFQYLEIDDPAERLTPGNLTIETRHAAMPDDDAATFSSSDPKLDAIWALTRRSSLYVSQEQFVDTPTREKGQFLLDSYDDSQATTRAFGEQNLTWQALRDFARSQARYWPDGRLNVVYPNGDGARDIPDNTERYPDWVWQYFVATGDRATLVDLAPIATRVAEYIAAAADPATGLVTKLPGGGEDYLYGAVDWPPPMRYGYDMSTVARTTVNALAVDAYGRVAQMAGVLGDAATAARWTARRDALAAAMNQRLRRPDGVYVDGLESDGSASTHASQQASAFALAYGVTPPAARATVGGYVAHLGIAMGPDNGLVLLRALHASGRDADALRLLTDPSGPGWAQIVAQGGTFTWETWAPDDADGDSTSHGWGSAALAALPESFLGATTAAPGSRPTGARVDITEPQATLTRVSGRVPTVSGPVRITWRRAGRRTELALRVPANGSVTLHLHASDAGHVVESGNGLADRPGLQLLPGTRGTVNLTVGAGSFSFRIS